MIALFQKKNTNITINYLFDFISLSFYTEEQFSNSWIVIFLATYLVSSSYQVLDLCRKT